MSEESPKLPTSTKDFRVLVVDDEPEIAKSVAQLVAGKGFRAAMTTSGEAAIRQFDKHDFDLVLLDLAMPELDGEEVLRRMRADSRLRELPVLLATASAIDLDTMPRVAGFLRKPYPREVLFAMLDSLLEGGG